MWTSRATSPSPLLWSSRRLSVFRGGRALRIFFGPSPSHPFPLRSPRYRKPSNNRHLGAVNQLGSYSKLPCNQLISQHIYMLDNKSLKFYLRVTIMPE
jgi:hypothetical protein